jgi:predicted enzyme related to lactoylglutathione lyase
MGKVTGLGGIFFKCNDPKAMNDWYTKNLGLDNKGYGVTFEWREADSEAKGSTTWSTFAANTKYFEPSSKDFMINYRVDNLVELIEQLKKAGITIVDELQDSKYGKFIHILDPEGNKVELWEAAAE